MIADPQLICEELENKIKVLEAENKTLREREFTLLRALPEIVFMLDMEEHFIFLNNTCKEKFRLSKNEDESEIHLKDVITHESLLHLRKLYLKEPYKDNLHAKELQGVRKDGTQFPFTAYFTKFVRNGKLVGFIGVGFDITERIDIENKLKEANLAKMKFLSIIAHDLRNPFNSLVGFSTLLLSNFERYNDQKIKEYIEFMSMAANQGHQLLENLLDWARANLRKIDVNPVTFNLNNIAADSIKVLSGNASKKEIRVELNISESIHVYADQNMIRTVIRNMLSNAIKFTQRKGLIQITARETAECAIIEVIDNGVGIDPEKLPNLFSLSNDYSSLGTEKEKGTGLGLILCYEFISINKGTIEAESKPGCGSTFRITIPRYKYSFQGLLPS
jgi:PAS domain S-box-containing protein